MFLHVPQSRFHRNSILRCYKSRASQRLRNTLNEHVEGLSYQEQHIAFSHICGRLRYRIFQEAGIQQRHKTAEIDVPGIHQALRGRDVNALRIESEDRLHRIHGSD